MPQPDDSEPSPERQAELRAAYEANVVSGKPPYAGVAIHTRGEINWIVKERGWRTRGITSREQNIDLRNVGFNGAVLNDVGLGFANLSGANIGDANFSAADLSFANLSGTFIGEANFRTVGLSFANLSGALIIKANFSKANLGGVNLSGTLIIEADFSKANLAGVNLSGAIIAGDFRDADLAQARMDATTVLGSADASDATETFQLDGQTRLLDVAWNGAILANVRWEQVPRLGDEVTIKAAKSRAERIKALRDAARAYRGLAKSLQAQGLTIPALRYRAREQQLERRALLYSFAIGPWLFSWLLNLVSGYGDKPGRALSCYLAVVASFTAAYWAVTNQVFGFIQSDSARLRWYEALVLSISSFHGRGFFPSTLTLGDPIALIAAAEAIVGLFIELVFIATFTQRFFAR